MLSKSYFTFIAWLQEALLVIGIGVLLVLPPLLAYTPEQLPENMYIVLFGVSLLAVFLVMSIRPLADLLPTISWVRPLVILRKGFGVLSAAIVVAIMFSRVMVQGEEYFLIFVNPSHWSIADAAILAPLGDISALILLATSNKYSKRVLGKWWKRVQKLAYVYFYAGALYEYIVLDQLYALVAAVVVTILVLAAYITKRLPV